MIWFIFTKAEYPEGLTQFQPFLPLNGVFLSVMCALHIFWFTMFFKILNRYISTGEAKDLQNKVKGQVNDGMTGDSAPVPIKTSSPRKNGNGKRAEKLEWLLF